MLSQHTSPLVVLKDYLSPLVSLLLRQLDDIGVGLHDNHIVACSLLEFVCNDRVLLPLVAAQSSTATVYKASLKYGGGQVELHDAAR
jgi:hypothetical protein